MHVLSAPSIPFQRKATERSMAASALRDFQDPMVELAQHARPENTSTCLGIILAPTACLVLMLQILDLLRA